MIKRMIEIDDLQKWCKNIENFQIYDLNVD